MSESKISIIIDSLPNSLPKSYKESFSRKFVQTKRDIATYYYLCDAYCDLEAKETINHKKPFHRNGMAVTFDECLPNVTLEANLLLADYINEMQRLLFVTHDKSYPLTDCLLGIWGETKISQIFLMESSNIFTEEPVFLFKFIYYITSPVFMESFYLILMSLNEHRRTSPTDILPAYEYEALKKPFVLLHNYLITNPFERKVKSLKKEHRDMLFSALTSNNLNLSQRAWREIYHESYKQRDGVSYRGSPHHVYFKVFFGQDPMEHICGKTSYINDNSDGQRYKILIRNWYEDNLADALPFFLETSPHQIRIDKYGIECCQHYMNELLKILNKHHKEEILSISYTFTMIVRDRLKKMEREQKEERDKKIERIRRKNIANIVLEPEKKITDIHIPFGTLKKEEREALGTSYLSVKTYHTFLSQFTPREWTSNLGAEIAKRMVKNFTCEVINPEEDGKEHMSVRKKLYWHRSRVLNYFKRRGGEK
ncbi:MAG: hypothetical protein AB7E13_10805 [Arcobacteraceae bacterium]